MSDFAPLLRSRLQGGASLEDALASLRQAGATPVGTIKAVREVLGVDLREAKGIFDASPAWRLEAAAGHQLHEEVLRMLREDGHGAL
jgi:ribosomal protein L7/L12